MYNYETSARADKELSILVELPSVVVQHRAVVKEGLKRRAVEVPTQARRAVHPEVCRRNAAELRTEDERFCHAQVECVEDLRKLQKSEKRGGELVGVCFDHGERICSLERAEKKIAFQLHVVTRLVVIRLALRFAPFIFQPRDDFGPPSETGVGIVQNQHDRGERE